MSVENLKREVATGWPDVPAATLALGVIEFMGELDDQELRMLTIPKLLDAVGRKEIDQEFLAALAILVSSTVHALDAKAFLCEEEGFEVHVDALELATARKSGLLEHPETGALIEDFESKLIPYFEVSTRFLEARAHG
ncbi:hypothetical protein [Sphingorhabdus sp.]|uniref:hypothetical protein n=1 Tax=Sphingorhabdus sp. TaxID=1902408 RepID=UPI00391A0E80